jgi:alanyl-tRNA synthetase
MKVNDIRQAFLNFFASKGHTIVKSSSLVPANDPTLLFTNSGMVQFKDVFLGAEQKNYTRATSSQRSVRAGGKHNDLENVGYTARHHTFFEMLGNFSFGDYFKKEAINYAWELLTIVYKLPADKLWVTVYQEDDEAYDIWLNEIGVPATRIIRIGDNKGARYASDNFWQMADTGPCGPCSEIFYDHGDAIFGGPPGSHDEDGDRYIEIWNLVFMQFNKDEHGVLHPLPKPCVDTGMGLERIAAVLQHVNSNYEIDLFANLIKDTAKILSFADLTHKSLRVIADHIRATSFLIIDGILPSNEGRGYVLRRIIRRAIRHGYKLGARAPFMYKLVDSLSQQMGLVYTELNSMQSQIKQTIELEEKRFFETLFNGMEILEQAFINTEKANTNIFSGEIAFKLHDTYGFPLDLTADICREKNMKVDEQQFEIYMQAQKDMARSAGKFKQQQNLEYIGPTTNFEGYISNISIDAKILALYVNGSNVDKINVNDTNNAILVLDKTPFYAQSGGQEGDIGSIKINDSSIFIVENTQKIQNEVIGHYGYMYSGNFNIGDIVQASINIDNRISTQRNHSATHLLHKALQDILGDHVAQKGSLVDAHKLRFDFSHPQAISDDEIISIEQQVNMQILANKPTVSQIMDFNAAKECGAMALFGEKYGDEVRVLNIGNSIELCGGTHVNATGDIGCFKILSEASVSSGIRRIEAITGINTLSYLQNLNAQSAKLAFNLKTSSDNVFEKVDHLQEQNKQLQKQVQVAQTQLSVLQYASLINEAKFHGDTSVLIKHIKPKDGSVSIDAGMESALLRDITDSLKDKVNIIILAIIDEANTKISLISTVQKLLHSKIKAGDIISTLSASLGGKGGGRTDMAQGGGVDISSLDKQLNAIEGFIISKLKLV